MRHFHSWYLRAHGGTRSFSWVKNTLQAAGAVQRPSGRSKHRKRRERAPMRGMMLHQDGSTHEWVPSVQWDLIVTRDDATSEHTSMFFVEEEGSASSFHGIGQTIAAKGLFAMLYTDRASHYFHTPEGRGKVDKQALTQVGRRWRSWASSISRPIHPRHAGARSGRFARIRHACPGNWRWRAFATSRRPIATSSTSTRPAYNAEFAVPAAEAGSAYVHYIGPALADILCEQFERTVGRDNCVSFEGFTLQIPADRHRHHYVKAKVPVHRYVDGSRAIFHGPRKLAHYDTAGS